MNTLEAPPRPPAVSRNVVRESGCRDARRSLKVLVLVPLLMVAAFVVGAFVGVGAPDLDRTRDTVLFLVGNAALLCVGLVGAFLGGRAVYRGVRRGLLGLVLGVLGVAFFAANLASVS